MPRAFLNRNRAQPTLSGRAVKSAIFGLLAIALGACASHSWAPGPGMNADDFGAAQAKCSLMARHAGDGFAISGSRRDVAIGLVVSAIGEAVRTNMDYNDCLLADGWRIADKPTLQVAAVPAPAEPMQAPVQAPVQAQANVQLQAAITLPASGNLQIAQITDISLSFKPCVSDIRAKPVYQAINAHLISLEGTRYTMTQLSDERVPSAAERRLLAAYVDETAACRARAMEALVRVAPNLASITIKAQRDNEKTLLMLVLGKLTWGEGERRQQDAIDALAQQLRNTPA